MLNTRDVVKNMLFSDTSYCQYGFAYKKATRIWHPMGGNVKMRPSNTPCDVFRIQGSHTKTAQRAPAGRKGVRTRSDICSLKQRYSMPPHFALAADLVFSIDDTRDMVQVLLHSFPQKRMKKGAPPSRTKPSYDQLTQGPGRGF